MCGDYDINSLNIIIHLHFPSSEFLESLFSYSLYPLINRPTRITQNSATLIYNIFSNALNDHLFTGILYTDISDHFPIFEIDNDQSNEENPNYIQARQYTQNKISLLQAKMKENDFSHVLSSNHPQRAFTMLLQKYSSIYQACFPIKFIKPNYRNKESWLTPDLNYSIKIKNKLRVKSIKRPSMLNINRFEEYKTFLNNLIKKSERRFIEQFKANNSIKSSNTSAWPHQLLVCMSLRKSLTEFILFTKIAAMMYGMYIINSVHWPEPRSSGINTSSNPQVSALVPRPAFNGM